MPFYVYILKCSDNSLYVGFTEDLNQRVFDHNSGKGAEYTSCRKPVELVFYEIFDEKEKALKRESQLKKWSKSKKQALIRSNLSELKNLSKCHSRHGRASDS